MPKYRKKPVVVEVSDPITDENAIHIAVWINNNGGEAVSITNVDNPKGSAISIRTLEGIMYGIMGDRIIKGVAGEFYPCKPDIFEATYELVNEEAAPAPPPHKGPWHVEQNTESTYYHVVNTPPGVYGASAFASYNEAEAIAVRDALNRLAAGASAPTPTPQKIKELNQTSLDLAEQAYWRVNGNSRDCLSTAILVYLNAR